MTANPYDDPPEGVGEPIDPALRAHRARVSPHLSPDARFRAAEALMENEAARRKAARQRMAQASYDEQTGRKPDLRNPTVMRAISGGPGGAESAPRVRAWDAADLDDSRAIEWLARKRIVAGAVNYMLGKEGIGKSLFLTWLTAKITTGVAVPEFGIPSRDPRRVILVLTEDDWATIARPRLEVAGADLRYVKVICEDRDGSGSPTFPGDMPAVEAVADGAAAVFVDAWADTLPSNISVKDPQQARQALHPWKELATRTGITVVLSGHMNRETGPNVRNAYGMTGELRKKARQTILAQADPDDEGVLVIGPEKTNVTAGTPASRFRIQSVQVFKPTDDGDGTVPRLIWVGDAEQSARDFFVEQSEQAEPGDRTERDEAGDWLESFLASKGGSEDKTVIVKAGKVAGHSERTLKRAFNDRKLLSERSGFPQRAVWSLPPGWESRQSGQRQLGQLGQGARRVPERGPAVSIGLTDDDLRKRNSDLGPTASVGPREPQLGQLGQARNTGPTAGPTADSPVGPPSTCLVCGDLIDPVAGDVHDSCERES